jgi:prevent-host-death family protein
MDTGHGHRTIAAGVFKQHCLALLDEVESQGVPIVVTKRGRPVAKVVPVGLDPQDLAGSVTVLAVRDEDLYATGERWHAEGDD